MLKNLTFNSIADTQDFAFGPYFLSSIIVFSPSFGSESMWALSYLLNAKFGVTHL
jgi:hypothetical protein